MTVSLGDVVDLATFIIMIYGVMKLRKVEGNTNGMSHRLEAMAHAAGVSEEQQRQRKDI